MTYSQMNSFYSTENRIYRQISRVNDKDAFFPIKKSINGIFIHSIKLIEEENVVNADA